MNERIRAGIVCGAALFFPMAAPVVGLAVDRNPFVRFHAWRCLLAEIFSTLVIGLLMIASLSWTLMNLAHAGWDLNKLNWWAVAAKSLVIWGLLSLWGAVNTIIGVYETVLALSGQMPRRLGLSGRLALRFSGYSMPSLSIYDRPLV